MDLLKTKKGVAFKKSFRAKPTIFWMVEKVLIGKLGPYTNAKWNEGIIEKC